MLKKRSIATMMAAATVATSVAPVFAATIVTETVKKGSDEQKALVDDLRKLLAEGTKYEVIGKDGVTPNTGYKVGDSVYEIRTTDATLTSTAGNFVLNDANTDSVENILALEKKIEALGKDEELYVYVVDKGHAVVNGKVSDVNAKGQDINAETLAKITVENIVSVIGKYDLADFYDGEYITAEGLDLINLVVNRKFDTNKYKNITSTVKEDVESTQNKERVITIDFDVEYVDTSKDDETFTIQISGKDLKDVYEFYDFIRQEGTRVPVGASKIQGDTRFETAVAIANEEHTTTAANIVLVNATSMIDGLTAAPLAKAKNAAVLLTNIDEIPTATLNYIKASKKVNGSTKVTIVGGTGVVSDKVKSQLQAIGVEVERLGGETRHETSIAVALEMGAIDKAYVVAATGEADAMSIAPVAAKGNDAIIVEGFNGMSDTANTLLKDVAEVDLIGGKVTAETQKAYDKKGSFIYGEDRFETNAKIIRNYFQDDEVNTIYVAKDGYTENNNEMLVDALAVGTLAAKENKVGPIVLASSELTVKQQEAVQLVKEADKATTVTQVGGGLKHSVVKQIAKILGFTNK